MNNTYMGHDPTTLAEARRMLLDASEDISKAAQIEKRRDDLIVQAFDLGATYLDVMVCTGLSRPTVYRIRRRAEQENPSREAGWDFTIPGHYSKTDVPQPILEDTLQDGLVGLLDDVTDDDSQLGKDFSSPDLTDEQKAIRDAIHDLAARAAVSKTDIVASTALGITLTRHKHELALDKANKKFRAYMEQLHLMDKTFNGIPVNPSFLRFFCPTGKLVKHGISYRPGVSEAVGILVYNPDTRQYLGYFPDRKPAGTNLWLLTCTNGAEYDTTGQEHPAPAPVHSEYGTCTVIGPAKEQ
ncbi:helix-turn-helix domain-containing protein [Bifidobacterium asteroides]|uniref:Uncharacterized protein n=1 Tax=Bifidobacterium asteroides TaxID=1684 RepID=A0A6N7TWD0_9BIFI|nr:helix-turn-helix domain-containing protein [Bifidobacterium asteroides]MSD90160.1 hypothetical protein [Bifidobacterium asteroides]